VPRQARRVRDQESVWQWVDPARFCAMISVSALLGKRRGAVPFSCVQQLAQLEAWADVSALADLLIDCVKGGALVSFKHPLSRTKANANWRSIAPQVARGDRSLLVTRDSAGWIVGTVQVVLEQSENQMHRADISKLLVHSDARCFGLGTVLMTAAELTALRAGKTLLVLDAASGSIAERLCQRTGWREGGRIPDYALALDGRLYATTVFYKQLQAGARVIRRLLTKRFASLAAAQRSWCAVIRMALRGRPARYGGNHGKRTGT